MKIGNWFVFFAILLAISLTVGSALALTDQNSPRNITFVGDAMSPSGYGIKNASRIGFLDGSFATSWNAFVTLVNFNNAFWGLQDNITAVNASAQTALTNAATAQSTANAAITGVSSVNSTAVSALNTANAASSGLASVNATAISAQSTANAAATGVTSVNSTAQSALTTANSAVTVNNAQYTNITGVQSGISQLNSTKAGTGTATCATGFVAQNVTTTTGGITSQCVPVASGTGNISGSGTANDIAMFTAAGTIGNAPARFSGSTLALENNGFSGSSLNWETNTTNMYGTMRCFATGVNGVPRCDFDVYPIQNNGTTFLINRNINTTGGANVDIARADGTTNLNHRLSSNAQSFLDTSGRGVGLGTASVPIGIKFQVNATTNITGSLYVPELCLNGDCQTNWPSGGGSGLSGLTAGGVLVATNSTNAGTFPEIYYINNSFNLQTVIDSCTSGCTINLARGNYIINNLNLTNNVRLIGQGVGETIFTCSAANACIKSKPNQRIYNVDLENIYLNGSLASGGIGIDTTNISLSSYANIKVNNFDVGLYGNGNNYYNEFYHIDLASNNQNILFEGASNENHFFGGTIKNANQRLLTVTNSNQVVFTATAWEGSAQIINITGTSIANHFTDNRFELSGASKIDFGSSTYSNTIKGGHLTQNTIINDLGTGNIIIIGDLGLQFNLRSNAQTTMKVVDRGSGQTTETPALRLEKTFSASGNPSGITVELPRTGGNQLNLSYRNESKFLVQGTGKTTINSEQITGPVFVINATGNSGNNITNPTMYVSDDYSGAGTPTLFKGDVYRTGGRFLTFDRSSVNQFYVNTSDGSVWTNNGSFTGNTICLSGDCKTAWPSAGDAVFGKGANATGDYLMTGFGFLANGSAVAYASAVPVYGVGAVSTPLNANGSRNVTLIVPTTTGDEVLTWTGSAFSVKNVTGGSFSYNAFFNQNLNTTNTVAFNNVTSTANISIVNGDLFVGGSRRISNAGRIEATSGTAAAPGLHFPADSGANTGLYRVAEDHIGVSTNGVLRLNASNNGVGVSGSLCLNDDCRTAWPTGGGSGGVQVAGTPSNGWVTPWFNSTHLNGTLQNLYLDQWGATFSPGFSVRTGNGFQSFFVGDYGGGPNLLQFITPNATQGVQWASAVGSISSFEVRSLDIDLDGNVTVSSGNSLCVGGRCLSNKVYTPNDYLTNNNSRYVNTNLTLTLPASSNVLVRCELYQDSAAATTGQQLMVNTTGSPTTVRTTYTSMSSASAMESFSGTSTSSNALADLGGSTAASIAQLRSVIVTSGSPSVFTIELRSEISGSETRLRRGSNCEYETY